MSARPGMPTEDEVRWLLAELRSVAVVGASPNPYRASHEIMAFLKARGVPVVPVNPLAVGQVILGEAVVGSLADVHGPIDVVDIFRNSAVAGRAVDEAIAEASRLGLRAVWLQLGVTDDEAMARAAAAGLLAVQDRCIAIEYARLLHQGAERRLAAP